MSLLNNFGGFYRLTNGKILLTGNNEPEGDKSEYVNAEKLSPQDNPEAFNYGAIVDFTNGASLYLSSLDAGEPYNYPGDYIDNAGSISSAAYDDEDFKWIVSNFNVITAGFLQISHGNDDVKQKFESYLLSKKFTLAPSEDGYAEAAELADVLQEYLQLIQADPRRFDGFFGNPGNAVIENIKKNIVGATGTYESIVPVLSTQQFGLDNFKTKVSAYANNIVNPNYLLDSIGGYVSIDDGGYFPPSFGDVGEYTTIGDNGQITVLDPAFTADSLLSDIEFFARRDAFEVKNVTLSSGPRLDWSYRQETGGVDAYDGERQTETVIPHWVPTVGIPGRFIEYTEDELSDQQKAVKGKILNSLDLITWDSLREIFKPDAPITFTSNSEIIAGDGKVPVIFNTDDLILDKYLEAIEDAEAFDPTQTDEITFSSFYRTKAYEAADFIIGFYADQITNQNKALLLKAFIDSLADDVDINDALQNALAEQQSNT